MTTAELDLADTANIPVFAKGLVERFGPIDILVNNTGGPAYGGAAGRPIEDWRSAFQDMVLSVIALTDALLPGMRARRWGRILTVISSGVIQPIPILAISNSLRASLVELVEDAVGRDRRRRRDGEHSGARAHRHRARPPDRRGDREEGGHFG